MRKKICIVIQRYGIELVSDVETYCRIYAEKLNKLFDIEVITTCAIDSKDWGNHYPDGICEVNGVKVRRFLVDFQKEQKKFDELTSKIFNNSNNSIDEAQSWVIAQGPVSSGLISYIEQNKGNFDIFIFISYLHYPTVMGLPLVKEKAILVPFAQKEPAIYLNAYNEIFTEPKGIIYNSEEEMVFCQTLFKNKEMPSILAGIGINIPTQKEYFGGNKKFMLNFPYILHIGEINKSTRLDDLVNFFHQYRRQYKNNLKLVFVGNEAFKIPKDKNIISFGNVSEDEKYDILKNSIGLVLPSQDKCFSIPILEAFAFNKPVLVNGHNESSKGHCIKSDAGLFFYAEVDFIACLDLLYKNKELRDAMGRNGEKYIAENFQWNNILTKLTKFINYIC